MGTKRSVTVTLTRYYSKQVNVEIEVDDNIQGEELKDYLTENSDLNESLYGLLENTSLSIDDDSIEFEDPKNGFGDKL